MTSMEINSVTTPEVPAEKKSSSPLWEDSNCAARGVDVAISSVHGFFDERFVDSSVTDLNRTAEQRS
jgi:hypothetical protein